MNFKRQIDNITNKLNSNFGLIIIKNGNTVYEKYNNISSKSRFRIFSGTKIITAFAIMLLIQNNKLKLKDTINKFGIDIPYCNKITILHLLNHTSGIYDVYDKLYVKLNLPEKLKIKNNKTGLIDFGEYIKIINNNKPKFEPIDNPLDIDIKYYNNTGYDLLGYIIFFITKTKPSDFIRKNIFDKLGMLDSGFQFEENKWELKSYESNYKLGIHMSQNWFCANAFISCSLLDYTKFLLNYNKLINKKILDTYKKLYFFKYYNYENKNYIRLGHIGGGDFKHNHLNKQEEYFPLQRTMMQCFEYKKEKLIIVFGENYLNTNSLFGNNYDNWKKIQKVLYESPYKLF